MKHCFFIIGLFIIVLSLVALQPPLWPQGNGENSKKMKGKIEGVWAEVVRESQGVLVSYIPEPLLFNSPGPPVPFLWKISKGTIESGPDNYLFPTERFAFELNPEKKPAELDLIPLDKDGKKMLKGKILGIYSLTGDYLIICTGKPLRPKSFTTVKKADGMAEFTWVIVLRRGTLDANFPKEKKEPKGKDQK